MLLEERTGLADVRIDFKFKGISEIKTVIMSVTGYDDAATIINSVRVNELIATKTQSIVGNVPKQVLTIDMISNDKELIPTNKESKYYGLMDSSCVIYVYVRAVGDDTDWSECAFGKFFVTSWRPKSSTEDNKSVSIEAVCRMGALMKSSIPNIKLFKGYDLQWYIHVACNKINQSSENDDLKFSTEIQLDKYNTTSDLMLKASNMGELLNLISLSNIKFIFFDRQYSLKSKSYLGSEDNIEPIVKLTDSTSVVNGVLDTGTNLYGKLNVNYVGTQVSEEKQLATVTGHKLGLSTDTNAYTTVSFPALPNNVYKITGVQLRYLNEDVSDVEVRDISYNGNSVTLRLLNWSSSVTEVDITIMGQEILEYDLLDTYTIDSSNEASLDITNRLGEMQTIDEYGDEMCELLRNTKSLEITGNFNIKIQPGDIIEVELETLETHCLALVIGCNWEFDGAVNCKMSLLVIKELSVDKNENTEGGSQVGI